MTENEAPGWDAIDKKLVRLYGEQQPLHWGTVVPASLGGEDPLDGISAYVRAEPVPHWHFVSFGLSDLYGTGAESSKVSGRGFELTFRLKRKLREKQPPSWVLNFLQNLARYVISSGNGFEAGHYLDLHGPIALGSETAIQSIILANDPELTPIATPHGRLAFLQVVGVTLDELQAAKAWSVEQFTKILSQALPLLVTDVKRTSVLKEEPVAQQVAAGTRRDGSATEQLSVQVVRFRVGKSQKSPGVKVTIGANGMRDFPALLAGRIPFGRTLTLHSRDAVIEFVPGKQCKWKVARDGSLQVSLTDEAVGELAGLLAPKAGAYSIASIPGLEILIEKSLIKDAYGKTIRVIG